MSLRHKNRIYEHIMDPFIKITHHAKNLNQSSSGIVGNKTNNLLKLFYIGLKGLTIQNSIISEMFLRMVNLMEYDTHHFLQIIEHKYIMYNKLFGVYSTLDVVKMYGFRSCQKRTRGKGFIKHTIIFLSTRD